MNRISAYFGTVKSKRIPGGVMAQPYRNGAEALVEWRQWKQEVWDRCPFGILDRAKRSASLCPCALQQVNAWMIRLSGYLGTVKLAKYLARKNGNGNGKEQGLSSVNGGVAEEMASADQRGGRVPRTSP
jgi:hypothetical protein